jgi:acetyl-CoA carboxylase, biotin carboxylase subunit
MGKQIQSILIANRGEIAVRILRACRELGIRSVSVYSDVDRTSPHVLLADESYHIGPPPSTQSYLNYDTIISVAEKAGVDAIHPGYGFLSENPAFARAIERAGIIFIGPPAAAIEAMGDKTAARTLMEKAGVPIVPGTVTPLTSGEEADRVAEGIGFPVILKAAGGGGGKGMRIVENPADLQKSFKAARNEARSAFGDDRIYLEKYLRDPKHIEIQIFADDHGSFIHLGERECSIQRRHQKIIEESPSSAITDTIRRKMGQAAVNAAKICGYRGAGTVEFLLDADKNFYFLEMNTRVQVEHPVTELVTGVDIVKEQIMIASGEPLSIGQEEVFLRGHAIECRIYAEDPLNNFLPSVGTVRRLQAPSGPGIREDRGIEEGNEVTTYYDPLLSKLLAWGRTRHEALARMERALGEYVLQGIVTNIPACIQIIRHPIFIDGSYTTHFMAEHYATESVRAVGEGEQIAIAAALAHLLESKKKKVFVTQTPAGSGNTWKNQNR